MEKIMRDLVGEYSPVYVFMNRYQDIVGILGGYDHDTGTESLRRHLGSEIEKLAGGKCCVSGADLPADGRLQETYSRMRDYAKKVMECRPIVMDARKYIYEHYDQRDLDLTKVADAIGCNPSYLSRVMKQELGISFKRLSDHAPYRRGDPSDEKPGSFPEPDSGKSGIQ